MPQTLKVVIGRGRRQFLGQIEVFRVIHSLLNHATLILLTTCPTT
jgi:hypothetical protein